MFEREKVSPKAVIVGLISFVAITVLLTVGIERIGPERIRAFMDQAGPLAPLVYIGVRALTYIIAPLSSGPIQFAAGVMFGLWQGTLYSIIGEVIGGSVNFWIARTLGRPVVARFVGKDGMGKVEQFYNQVGQPAMLIYARLFLFAVYDFISYAAGLTKLKYRHYLIITIIAGFVPTFIAVYVGSNLTGNPQNLLLMYAALGVFGIAAFALYGHVRRWLKLDQSAVANTAKQED
jgi:uncharacterized membrane protein YdjX (TVP38/TMEM64 family)